MIGLSYLSRNAIHEAGVEMAPELNEILKSARRNNPSLGLTGALIFNHDCFAQVLEGPQDSVDGMYRRIATDPRHSDVKLLHREALERRRFPDWSMAFAAVETRAADGLNLDQVLTALNGPNHGRALAAVLHNLMRLHAEQTSEFLAWPSFDPEPPAVPPAAPPAGQPNEPSS